MKHERFFTALTAAVLSSLLATGAVGCVVTGFDLELESLRSVFLLCAGSAVLFSVLFSLKWGVSITACLLSLAGGWLWHRGILWDQLMSLLVRISKVYHEAYHWGYFLFAEPERAADHPIGVLGVLIALTAAFALVRRKSILPPLTLSGLALASCMVVTDTVPDTVFLFLLLAGFLLCLIPQSVRRESAAQGCRLTAMIALPVLLVLLLMFLAIPQGSYVNQSEELQAQILNYLADLPRLAQQTAEELSTGLPDDGQQTLDLKRMGARPRYTYAVMDITADTGGTLYLRGQDYDVYTGTGWTASPHRAEPFGTVGSLPNQLHITTRGKKEFYFLPYYPSRDTVLAGGALKNPQQEREYSVSYTSLPENWQEILEAEEASQDYRIELTDLDVLQFGSTADRLRYTTLPGETKVAAEKILSEILPETATRWETAEIIAEFVKNSAEYDLSTGRMPSEAEDFALWFLSESDTGYCVHFATAAVVLLRAADIPARYVTGYLAEARAGEALTVTAGDAHAWAEYYVPQLEIWVVLEATPTEQLSIGPSTDAPGTAETIPVYTEIPQPQKPPPATQPVTPTLPEEAPEVTDSPNRFWWLLVLPGMAAALWAQRVIRLACHRKRMEVGNVNQQALARWTEAARLCRLRKQTPPDALYVLAQKAKFSQHILTDGELAQFDAFLDATHAALKQQPWYYQIAYRLVFVVY